MLRVKYGVCLGFRKSAQIDTKSMISMRLLDIIKY